MKIAESVKSLSVGYQLRITKIFWKNKQTIHLSINVLIIINE